MVWWNIKIVLNEMFWTKYFAKSIRRVTTVKDTGECKYNINLIWCNYIHMKSWELSSAMYITNDIWFIFLPRTIGDLQIKGSVLFFKIFPIKYVDDFFFYHVRVILNSHWTKWHPLFSNTPFCQSWFSPRFPLLHVLMAYIQIEYA